MQTHSRTNPAYANLFGFNNRTRYLIGIAQYGPIRSRELGRILDIDSSRLPGFFRDLVRLGVVSRDDVGRISLNESYFAFPELSVLLHAMAGRRAIVVPDDSAWFQPRRGPLFGTSNRTRVLVALSAAGNCNLKDLSLVAGVHPRTVIGVVKGLARDGILRRERDARNSIVSFEELHPLFPILRSLLERLQDAYKDIARRARGHRRLVEDRARFAETSIDDRATLPIGTPAQAKALIALAQYGTLTAAMLARITGAPERTSQTLSVELSRYGLVVRRTLGTGPLRKTWIRLNESHPVYLPLRRFVIAAYGRAIAHGPLPPKQMPRSVHVKSQRLPGHPLRFRIFTETYDAEELDIAAMAKRLRRSDRRPIRRWAEDLAAAGLLDYGAVGNRMFMRAKRDRPAALQLRALAEAMRRFKPSR